MVIRAHMVCHSTSNFKKENDLEEGRGYALAFFYVPSMRPNIDLMEPRLDSSPLSALISFYVERVLFDDMTEEVDRIGFRVLI